MVTMELTPLGRKARGPKASSIARRLQPAEPDKPRRPLPTLTFHEFQRLQKENAAFVESRNRAVSMLESRYQTILLHIHPTHTGDFVVEHSNGHVFARGMDPLFWMALRCGFPAARDDVWYWWLGLEWLDRLDLYRDNLRNNTSEKKLSRKRDVSEVINAVEWRDREPE